MTHIRTSLLWSATVKAKRMPSENGLSSVHRPSKCRTFDGRFDAPRRSSTLGPTRCAPLAPSSDRAPARRPTPSSLLASWTPSHRALPKKDQRASGRPPPRASAGARRRRCSPGPSPGDCRPSFRAERWGSSVSSAVRRVFRAERRGSAPSLGVRRALRAERR